MREGGARIYLAGPDVFLADAARLSAQKCAMCAAVGLEGVFPLDGGLDLEGLDPAEQARRISLTNEALMRSCDAMIANLTPFRGASMDAGTAFEVGFMRALGRPVFAYTNVVTDYAARALQVRELIAGRILEFDGPEVDVENFGLAENLMIAVAAGETGVPVVRRDSAPGRIAHDLEGFRAVLMEAVTLLKAEAV